MPTISISTYNFTVYLQNITNGKDLIDKIDDFFIQIQIDKDYIAEPTSLYSYSVSFKRNDLAFDFKRYMLILKRSVPLYQSINIKLKPIEKKKRSNVLLTSVPTPTRQLKPNDLYISPYYVAQSPYITYEDMKRMDEKKKKKKWIDRRGFISSVGRLESDEYYY